MDVPGFAFAHENSSISQMTQHVKTFEKTQPDITVVAVNYNTAHLLDRMVSALEASNGGLQMQIIVVDNASRDDSVKLLQSTYPQIELIVNVTNVGFGRANNQALDRARGRFILLLNTDAFVAPDTLKQTLCFMKSNPSCGVLGVRLVDEDGILQPSCRFFLTPWNAFLVATGLQRWFPGTRLVDDMSWDHLTVRECDWVPGCYYLIRREVIDNVGLFDPRYFLYCEEMDHCRRVRKAGWKVIYYAPTEVLHIGGESAKSVGVLTHRQIPALQIESELLYFRRYFGVLGVFAAIALAILGDVINAFKALVRRQDMVQAVAAIRHSSIVLEKFIATRLASRATR